MAKKTLTVKGLTIQIEQVNENDFISLTDIAKQSEKRADILIASWMKNQSTLEFLETWERLHNPSFKSNQMVGFKDRYLQNRNILTPQIWVKEMGAIGIKTQKGRYGGGTLAHPDIALNFCYWLSPSFQVYLIKEFQRLKEEEFSRQSLEWHLTKITHNIDEIRNLLDTIPGQRPDLNRLNSQNDKP